MSAKRVWKWGPEQEHAFEKLHELLCSPTCVEAASTYSGTSLWIPMLA